MLTLIESLCTTSIDCFGTWIPIDHLSKFVINYAEPFVLHNAGNDDFPVSRRGSALRARLGNRYFLILTEHQMVSYPHEAAVVVNSTTKSIVTSNGSTVSKVDQHGEPVIDIRLFDFTDAVRAEAISKNSWLDLSKVRNINSMDSKRELQLTAGYPHLDRSIDYDRRDISVAPRVAYGRPLGETLRAREGFEVNPSLEYDPDGFSGAPVFSVVEQRSDWFLTLDGIVTNASRSRFNYVPFSYIRDFVVQSLDDL